MTSGRPAAASNDGAGSLLGGSRSSQEKEDAVGVELWGLMSFRLNWVFWVSLTRISEQAFGAAIEVVGLVLVC